MICDHVRDRMANLEQSVLAAIMMEPQVLDGLVIWLLPNHFANHELGLIYDAMRGLQSSGGDVDPTAVVEELRRRRLLNPDLERYVHELWGTSGSAVTASWCAGQIIEAWQGRELASACADAIRALSEPNAVRTVIEERLQGQIAKIGASERSDGPRSMSDDLARVSMAAERAVRGEGRQRRTHTGFAILDRVIGGLYPSQLVVLAAQTSMGKTALALNIAAHVAGQDAGVVVFFSMEMGRDELAARLCASGTGIELQRIINGSLSSDEWVRLTEAPAHLEMVGRNILLHVTGRMTTAEMSAHLRRVARQSPIALVVVDYLQKCAPARERENQYAQVSQISGDLKAMAVDLDVPVLALSQLSREAARRGGEPQLSDLRDSGCIEQDANVVLFIHRDNPGNSARLIIAKNRNGETGGLAISWDAKSVTFSDCSSGQSNWARCSGG